MVRKNTDVTELLRTLGQSQPLFRLAGLRQFFPDYGKADILRPLLWVRPLAPELHLQQVISSYKADVRN